MSSTIGVGGMSAALDEVSSNEFDLFSPIEIDHSIVKGYEPIYRPISSTNGRGPFTFEIPQDPNKFMSAESIRLVGRMRIRKVKPDGSLENLSAKENVAPINNIFQSLWSQVDLDINGTSITDPSEKWYAYKAYIEGLLSYSANTKSTLGHVRGWVADDCSKFEDMGSDTSNDSTNEGYKKRRSLFEGSKWVDFKIPLHFDISTVHKMLPPNVKLTITLHRNEDDFCIMQPAHNTSKFTIEVGDMRIKIRKYEVTKELMDYYNTSLKKNLPTLPIDRSLLKTYTVQKGSSDLTRYNVLSGKQLPDQVLVFMVDDSAYNGSKNSNPFNFKHNNLKEASLIVNGVHEPYDMYKLDIKNNIKNEHYINFLENTGIQPFNDSEHGVTLDDYYGGSFILAWDRSFDKCNRYHKHHMDSGSIDINLKTETPLAKNVKIVIYATYATTLVIDGNTAITPIF